MPAKKHAMNKAKSAAGRKALAKGKKMNKVKPLAVDAYLQFTN